MKKLFAVAALGLVVVAGPAFASAELAKQKNCLACHAVDKKLVGPAYKDVAAKYKSDKNAPAMLAKKIREGGVGNWGQVPHARPIHRSTSRKRRPLPSGCCRSDGACRPGRLTTKGAPRRPFLFGAAAALRQRQPQAADPTPPSAISCPLPAARVHPSVPWPVFR